MLYMHFFYYIYNFKCSVSRLVDSQAHIGM